jgi:hypothetical protein
MIKAGAEQNGTCICRGCGQSLGREAIGGAFRICLPVIQLTSPSGRSIPAIQMTSSSGLLDPFSDQYEVALYNSDRIVIERCRRTKEKIIIQCNSEVQLKVYGPPHG